MLDIVGSILSIVGCFLASNPQSWKLMACGYTIYVISNIIWIIWAIQVNSWAMVAQMIVFSCCSLYGLRKLEILQRIGDYKNALYQTRRTGRT